MRSADAEKIKDLLDISDDDPDASDYEMEEGWDRIDVDSCQNFSACFWMPQDRLRT